jgi:endonuclease G
MANEAIRVSTIYALLQSEFIKSPGVSDVVSAHQIPATTANYNEFKNKSNKTNIMDQPYHVNIPVTIVVGNGSSANSPLPQVTVSSNGSKTYDQSIGGTIPDSTLISSSADQTNLDVPENSDVLVESYRDGYKNLEPYNTKHLGPEVKLPYPSDKMLKNEILSYRDEDQNTIKEWLDYIHFSVMMNERWKFAMISAVNIDGSQEQTNIDRRKWFIDTRIEEEYQFNPKIKEYYGTKTMNRGHMVRREDPNWGERNLAIKANDFTFHLTNAVPQAASLNQKRWLILEDYIKDQAWNQNQKVSVFTAPILLELEENQEKGWFGKYKNTDIPMAFWKVVAYLNESNELNCAAFLMNQVVDVSRLELDFGNPTRQEIKVSQITLKELSRISGITFDENLYGGDAYAKQLGIDGNQESSTQTEIKRTSNIVL